MGRGPLVSLRRPSPAAVAAFLATQRDAAPAFPAPLPAAAPPGFVLDTYALELGRGPFAFRAARDALFAWRHVDLGWLDVQPRERPPRPGDVLAMLARVGGAWFASACRVRAVFDEPGRAGYEYVTLPAHVERGAERFSVTWAGGDSPVRFEIRAVSRPGPWWVAAGLPLARASQRRFGRESPAALLRAVREALA